MKFDTVSAAYVAAMDRAWPSARRARVDGGWELRQTPGVARRRCNSARALVAAPDLDRVPSRLVQVGLDDAVDRGLAARGWAAEAETAILVAPARGGASEPLDVERATWVRAWSALAGRDDVEATEREVLARIEPPVRYLLIDERAAAIVVADGPLAGIFCMVVAPAARRAGLARRLLAAAHATPGAQRLYLQVERDNLPARALYAGDGFVERAELAYRYRAAA